MLSIKDLSIIFNKATINEKKALDNINLELNDGDFVTIIGSNGAGKSTLLNAIAGSIRLEKGTIVHQDKDISNLSETKRSQFIGHLFQDPLKGTAPNMTIEQNLALAYGKDKHQLFKFAINKENQQYFKNQLSQLNLGLEERLKTKVGLLSGGQRQALTLLMATIATPSLLLLDEHTAALDPLIASNVMKLTEKIVKDNNITTLMVTHNIEHALSYGNKTIIMDNGHIIKILDSNDKKTMTSSDVLALFKQYHSDISDAMVLN